MAASGSGSVSGKEAETEGAHYFLLTPVNRQLQIHPADADEHFPKVIALGREPPRPGLRVATGSRWLCTTMALVAWLSAIPAFAAEAEAQAATNLTDFGAA
jgi:hypothetical protein